MPHSPRDGNDLANRIKTNVADIVGLKNFNTL